MASEVALSAEAALSDEAVIEAEIEAAMSDEITASDKHGFTRQLHIMLPAPEILHFEFLIVK